MKDKIKYFFIDHNEKVLSVVGLGALIGIVLIIGNLFFSNPAKRIPLKERNYLVKVSSKQSSEGSFILGTGTLNPKDYYVYCFKNKKSRKIVSRRISKDHAIIFDDGHFLKESYVVEFGSELYRYKSSDHKYHLVDVYIDSVVFHLSNETASTLLKTNFN